MPPAPPHRRRWRSALALLSLAAGLSGCASLYFDSAGTPPAHAPRTLADWPYAEYWTGIVFNGEKVGYAHLALVPAAGFPGSYEIRSESALRLRMLGLDKHVALVATDRVGADLVLEAFSHRYDIDGSRLELAGEVAGGTLTARVTNAGRTTELALPLSGPVLPASAIGLVPVQRGLRLGAEHRYVVFSGQTQSLAPVEQRVEAYERSELFEGAGFRVESAMLGFDTTTWLSAGGLPLLELGLGGIIVAELSTETQAKSFVARTALNKDASLLGFSLVRPDAPIAAPRAARRLDLALSGTPLVANVTSDPRQQCRLAGDALQCTLRSDAAWTEGPSPTEIKRLLRESLAVPANDERIHALAHAIAGDRPTPRARVDALLAWLRANIRKEPADAFSALDVLRTRSAECQGHAFLYAALARALGIPTRVANGVVYSEEHAGFLYHAWNESWVGDRWLAIDAALDQLPADATHVRLVYGEALAELAPLAGWVGRLAIRVLDAD